MKRFLLIFLACACIFFLAACNNTPDQPEETLPQATEAPVTEAPATEAPATEAPATEAPATEAPATEAPATEAPATEVPATENPATEAPVTEAPVTTTNNLYINGALSFEYPENWEEMEENGYVLLTNPRIPGNNITVGYEPKNEYYDTVDAESYKQLLTVAYESMGITIDSVTLDRVINANGVNILQIIVGGTTSGVRLEQTQYITSTDNRTYAVTVTEMNQDDALIDMVFNSIAISKEVDDSVDVEIVEPDIENTLVYTVEELSFEYPGNWTDLGTKIVSEDTKATITVQVHEMNPIFHIIDTEMCKELVIPTIEASGMTVTDIAAEHLENGNGEKIAVISVDATAMGIAMEIKEYVVSSANHSYLIAVASTNEDSPVFDLVFDSIIVTDDDSASTGTTWTGTKALTFDALTFEYPDHWIAEEDEDGFMLSESLESLVSVEVFKTSLDNGGVDLDAYIQETKDIFELMGMTMDNLKTETVKNGNGVEIIKISFEMDFLMMKMYMTEYMAIVGNESYSIQITEQVPGSPLLDLIFDSIDITEIEAPETDAPEVSVGNSISAGGLTFEYPADWTKASDTQAIDGMTGNNVNIVTEPKNIVYDTIDAETYVAATKSSYDAAGITVSNCTVEHIESSRGVKGVKISFTAGVSGFIIEMTQFVVHSGDQTCTITVTEVFPVDGLADDVFESITVE